MNTDQALGYLLRDPQSVEAEAGRALCTEMQTLGQEVAELRERLARKEPRHGSCVDLPSYLDMQAQARALADRLSRVEALAAKWLGPNVSTCDVEAEAECAVQLQAALKDGAT